MELRRLKEIWRKNAFRPNKRLGQNFLIDKNVRNNILDALSLTPDTVVIEIGSGFGMMTFDLAKRCARVFAVEKDAKICALMEKLFKEKGNITPICADILDVDLCSLIEGKKSIAFGNIPYYISTPIIEKILGQSPCIRNAYIVIQDELADRIVALPGSKKYGSFSCFTQFYSRPRKIFKISKNSFYPVPQVDSSLLEIALSKEPTVKVRDEDLMFKIIRKAFSERRKKVVNPLSGGNFLSMDRLSWERIFEACGLLPSLRAENLSLPDYARLADAVKEKKDI